MSDLGDNLTRLSGLHKLTTSELASILGMSRQSVSALLNGHSEPKTSTLLKIERLFGVGSEIVTLPLDEIPAFADIDRYLSTESRISEWRLARLPTLDKRSK